jgi:hypothetical protein
MSTLGKIILALAGFAATLAPLAGPSAAAESQAAAGVTARSTLRPITFGIERPQQVALAAAGAAAYGNAALRPQASRQAEVVIDVLVAYTAKAARLYRDIEREVVVPAIEEANRSFALSGIGHVKLRLVNTLQTNYAEQGSHFDHLWHMADRGDWHMESVHTLREVYRADIAILIVDDAKGCGLATRVGADAGDAFAVVHHACAVSNYTVAHEIGHLMGARHEHAFVSDAGWRDIMSLRDSCGGCPRLPLWSNPLVLVGGEPAGTAELNNAAIIASNARRVAAFR